MAICRWKSLTLDYSLDLELYLYGALHPFFFKIASAGKKTRISYRFFATKQNFFQVFMHDRDPRVGLLQLLTTG